MSHLQDTRRILWPAYPNQNLSRPGARSRWRLRPCLLQTSQPGKEMEKLTPSLSCQGLMLPGRWSGQRPHSQTGRAQLYADSPGRTNCGVILGPWGASQSFPHALKCCHRCQGGHPQITHQSSPGGWVSLPRRRESKAGKSLNLLSTYRMQARQALSWLVSPGP